MGVADGQAVSAGVTNPAFLDANEDDVAQGIIGFVNTEPQSGAFVDNIQAEANGISSFTGRVLNDGPSSLPSWTSNDVGTPTDNLFDRVDAISEAFADTGGVIPIGGRESVGINMTAVTVALPTVLATTNYTVIAVIENTLDTNPIFLIPVVTGKTTSSFDVSFNADTDSSNYVLNWFLKRDA